MPTSSDPRNELRQEIRQILETTARVDERFKTMVERQSELSTRLNVISDQLSTLQGRITIVESKNGEAAKRYIDAISVELRELSSRVDRVELVGSDPTKKLVNNMEGVSSKIDDIDQRLKQVEKHKNDWSDKLKIAGIEFFKMFLTMLSAYILFRWGISQ